MTGRGIDQILQQASAPRLFEPYVRLATDYIEPAERVSGSIPRKVDPSYVWGDAREELDKAQPQVRIVNLETAITVSEDAWADKQIHYRMHPANISCLTAAKLDCCVLANNHVLDWDRRGLEETLGTVHRVGIQTAGAGQDAEQAAAAAILTLASGERVLVFGLAHASSGVPAEWAATRRRSGVNYLADLSNASVDALAAQIARFRRPRDLVVLSIHWSRNWGYAIDERERRFAHALIDHAGVHVLHGHSSHHVKAIEIYQQKPILYGCGDLLNDYEGIGGREGYHAELGLLYLPALSIPAGNLLRLVMVPTRIQRFCINRARQEETAWLRDRLARECEPRGAQVRLQADGTLALSWN
jgi:poly-gamma-glutamate capsule biosynthesis protein CapA/YwtB (metallophosphatase superfamily)